MIFESEVLIDSYIKVLENKKKELAFLYDEAFFNYVTKQYNSFWNKYLFKKHTTAIKNDLKYELTQIRYGIENTHSKLYPIKKFSYDIEKCDFVLDALKQTKKLGNEKVKITSKDLYLFNRYLDDYYMENIFSIHKHFKQKIDLL